MLKHLNSVAGPVAKMLMSKEAPKDQEPVEAPEAEDGADDSSSPEEAIKKVEEVLAHLKKIHGVK